MQNCQKILLSDKKIIFLDKIKVLHSWALYGREIETCDAGIQNCQKNPSVGQKQVTATTFAFSSVYKFLNFYFFVRNATW